LCLLTLVTLSGGIHGYMTGAYLKYPEILHKMTHSAQTHGLFFWFSGYWLVILGLFYLVVCM